MAAVVLQGAVLLKEQGTDLTLKRKCEKCGWVADSPITAGGPGKGAKTSTLFSCPKCKNNQKIEIQGV